MSRQDTAHSQPFSVNALVPETSRCLALLQALIRLDTTNPPGHEAGCVSVLLRFFHDAGIATQVVAAVDDRPNLIARLPGRGDSPPLLLQGHMDVVGTAGQTWTHDPFGAEIVDGVLWGRGALDDKSGIALFAAALATLASRGVEPPGDIVMVALADEEALGRYGAKFLVDEHPDLFDGVRYALGEGGGLSVTMAGRRCYPIMVAEKQTCRVRLTIRGKGGHGSVPVRGEAMARLGEVLRRLDRRRLPVHVTPAAGSMLATLGQALPQPQGAMMRLLSRPRLTDVVLQLIGRHGRQLDPLLHNTVSPTVVQGGRAINVIPNVVTLELDGRLLPGFEPDVMVAELAALLGDLAEIEVVAYEPGPEPAGMRRFETLAEALRRHDPEGAPFPYLLSGVTDARNFARLGIQSYGFVPLNVGDERLVNTIHGADERVPVAAIDFGLRVLIDVLTRLRG